MTREEIKAQAARYLKIVEWSEEDGCFLGSAPPLIGQCCHGKDEAEVYTALCQIVEEWIETLEKDGRELPDPLTAKNFSGKFVLRVEPVIHRRLAAKALAAGESLNSFCEKILSKTNETRNSPNIENSNFPSGMTPRQNEVFELLHDFSTEQKPFHFWYQGAIEIINSQSPDKIAQAAHSLRELCDKLPDAIMGIPKFRSPISAMKSLGPDFLEVKTKFYDKGWLGNSINQSLDGLLQRFENFFNEPARSKRFGRALTATDPQTGFLSKDWLWERDKVFEDMYGFLQNVAHHRHLASEKELNEILRLFESLLINYLAPCTAEQQNELLELMNGPANSQTYSRVSDLILHKTANFVFFFDKLENPDWLPILDEKGFFKNLPGPETTDDGRIIYKHYLPLVVLARLAGTFPKPVLNILLKISLPDNPYIGDQILQCMAKLRDPICIQQLSPLIVQLAETPTRTSWTWVHELLKSWMELKVYPELFAVIRAYLNSAVDKLHSHESSTWLAKQVEEQILQELTAIYPLEVARIIFQALSKWATLEREKYKKSQLGDDSPMSYYVEDFKITPLIHQGIEATLARRLFLAAERIYNQGNLEIIEEVEQLLISNSWQLFKRLRWQLYADFPVIALKRARAEVLKRIPFLNKIDHSGSHDYEFAQLLSAHTKKYGDAFLTPDEVEQFVINVFKGPIDYDGNLMDGNNDFFYRKQLWPIAALLRGERLATYRILVPDDSKIKIESFKPFSPRGVSGGFVGSKAPKEVENFGLMKDEDLWAFLNTWQPKEFYEYDSTGALHHENIFALADEFVNYVEKFPQRFNPVTKWWENIKRWEIVNKFLDRAANQLSKNQANASLPAPAPSEADWINWFGITEWAMSQPWPREAVSRFLRNALQSNYIIPNRYFVLFPEFLRRLIGEDDARLSGRYSFGDFTTAINSVRGESMESLLHLASRQKNASQTIESWIFELIRSRLKLPEESPAVFALFGAHLRFLIHLFNRELKESPDLLFPPDRPEHRSATIIAHFKYDQPWNLLIQTFPKLITLALDTLEAMEMEVKQDKEKKSDKDFAYRFGVHIACYYWSDSFAIAEEGEAMLNRFFKVASNDARAMLISQIASIWEKHNQQPEDEKIIPKVLHIWERRYAQIEKKLKRENASYSDYEGELAESIDWLCCECFPFTWRFKYAKASLELLEKAPQPYHLLKAITDFSLLPDRLGPMLELLQALLNKPSETLRWSIQFKDLAPVISLGFSSDKSNIKKLAEKCKDLLLKSGFSEFLKVP